MQHLAVVFSCPTAPPTELYCKLKQKRKGYNNKREKCFCFFKLEATTEKAVKPEQWTISIMGWLDSLLTASFLGGGRPFCRRSLSLSLSRRSCERERGEWWRRSLERERDRRCLDRRERELERDLLLFGDLKQKRQMIKGGQRFIWAWIWKPTARRAIFRGFSVLFFLPGTWARSSTMSPISHWGMVSFHW